MVREENRFGNLVGLDRSQCHTDRRGGTHRNAKHDRDEDRGLDGYALAVDDLGSFERTREHDPAERADPDDDAILHRVLPEDVAVANVAARPTVKERRQPPVSDPGANDDAVRPRRLRPTLPPHPRRWACRSDRDTEPQRATPRSASAALTRVGDWVSDSGHGHGRWEPGPVAGGRGVGRFMGRSPSRLFAVRVRKRREWEYSRR
jgi:hypothetical protein